jgi:hypothetical protein
MWSHALHDRRGARSYCGGLVGVANSARRIITTGSCSSDISTIFSCVSGHHLFTKHRESDLLGPRMPPFWSWWSFRGWPNFAPCRAINHLPLALGYSISVTPKTSKMAIAILPIAKKQSVISFLSSPEMRDAPFRSSLDWIVNATCCDGHGETVFQ